MTQPSGCKVRKYSLPRIRLTSSSVSPSYCSSQCRASGSWGLLRCNRTRSPSQKRESFVPQDRRKMPFFHLLDMQPFHSPSFGDSFLKRMRPLFFQGAVLGVGFVLDEVSKLLQKFWSRCFHALI